MCSPRVCFSLRYLPACVVTALRTPTVSQLDRLEGGIFGFSPRIYQHRKNQTSRILPEALCQLKTDLLLLLYPYGGEIGLSSPLCPSSRRSSGSLAAAPAYVCKDSNSIAAYWWCQSCNEKSWVLAEAYSLGEKPALGLCDLLPIPIWDSSAAGALISGTNLLWNSPLELKFAPPSSIWLCFREENYSRTSHCSPWQPGSEGY